MPDIGIIGKADVLAMVQEVASFLSETAQSNEVLSANSQGEIGQRHDAQACGEQQAAEKIIAEPSKDLGGPRVDLSFLPVHGSTNYSTKSRLLAIVETIIRSPYFEGGFGILIVLNALVMGFETQYDGTVLKSALEREKAIAEGVEPPPLVHSDAAVIFTKVCGWFFGFVFTVEISLKLIGQRKEFVKHAWNWIDSILVFLWLMTIFVTALPVDANLLRLARLARLVRLVRLAHTIQSFDALYLISTSIASSLSILAWAVLLFLVMQVALALALSNLLKDAYLEDTSQNLAAREEVYVYFGTFTRALFSTFEITLANWPPISRKLAENVSQWFMVFGVLHKLTVGFAFVGVVNGVFMQETFKVASQDDRIMIRQKERTSKAHKTKMTKFFNQTDTSGDGTIDLDEFKTMMSNPAVVTWLAAMELEEKDHDVLFSLIDTDGQGLITLDMLMRGVGRLKGMARSVDVVRLLREIETLKASVHTSPLFAGL
eukprot:TRINITY_DN5853_c1_g1_i1.p1 TRINITY_DN5853_c1_g1~~TRINITY_DN5853_c1_g1_i1.p1  ORF type:complete len:566 (+),score=101.14 TRINITY_DN5853_c1_g1_i1:236-1699(+)